MKKSMLNLSVLLFSCITFNISSNKNEYKYVDFEFLKNHGFKFDPESLFSFKIKGHANPPKDIYIEKAIIYDITVIQCKDEVSNQEKCKQLEQIIQEIIENKTTSIEKMGNQLKELFYNSHVIERNIKYCKDDINQNIVQSSKGYV